MRKILRGNDFVLRIKLNRVTPEGTEGFKLTDCSGLTVRLVGAFRRYVLESVVSEDDASVLLARVEGDKVALGVYGVEVVGRIGGDDWRSYKCGQVGIVECEEDADLGDGEDGNLFEGLPLVSLEDAEVLTGVKVVFDTEKLDFYAVLVDALYPRLYYIETDAPSFQQGGYYTAPVNGVAVGNVATNGASLSPNGGTYFRVIKLKVAQMGISGLFAYNMTLREVSLKGMGGVVFTNTSGMFIGCTSLASIDLSGLDFSSVTNWYCAFYNVKADIILRGAKLSGSLAEMCRCAQDMTYMDISDADFGEVTNVKEMLLACYGLTTLIGDHTLEEVENGDVRAFVGLTKGLRLYDCTKLDRASLLATIKGLADLTGETSQTLMIGNTLKAKLTDEDIAIATAKNWIIA